MVECLKCEHPIELHIFVESKKKQKDEGEEEFIDIYKCTDIEGVVDNHDIICNCNQSPAKNTAQKIKKDKQKSKRIRN
jgi:hypothetical protein